MAQEQAWGYDSTKPLPGQVGAFLLVGEILTMASNENAGVGKLITFGKMAIEQGWYDQAREYFEQALALDASNREAMKGLARVNEILSRKASFEPAKPEVSVAKPAQPEKPEIEKWLDSAQEKFEAGHYELARGYLEQVLKLDPTNQEAKKGLAQIEETLRRKTSLEPVKPEVPVAKPAQPEKPEIEKLLDTAQENLEVGHYEQARSYLEQVLELDPANREAMKGLARVYERLSRKEAAAVKPTRTRVEPTRLPSEEAGISYEEKVPLEVQKERIQAAKKSYPWLPIVVVGALLLACFLCVITSGGEETTTRSSFVSIGEEGRLYIEGVDFVQVCVDEKTLDEVTHALTRVFHNSRLGELAR